MSRRPSAHASVPIPREHGAWGLLLQPFVAAAVLSGLWNWTLAVALLLVVLGFMVKEPLVVLARQQWVWRSANPRTPRAARWLFIELVGILACLAILVRSVPLGPLVVLSGAAFLLTLLAVWFTVTNRQRSIMLQLLSAAGLSTSALLVVLLSEQRVPEWAWQLWAILTLHAGGSILVVHERLKRIAGRSGSAARVGSVSNHNLHAALSVQIVQLAAGVWLVFVANAPLWLPLLFSAFVNCIELYRLRNPASLDEPLMRVGFRTLGFSIAHMVVTMMALWSSARA